MANVLNKGVEGLGALLDNRLAEAAIQGVGIVVSTGAAPLPNCISPIVDLLDKIQTTIATSKALQVCLLSLVLARLD